MKTVLGLRSLVGKSFPTAVTDILCRWLGRFGAEGQVMQNLGEDLQPFTYSTSTEFHAEYHTFLSV